MPDAFSAFFYGAIGALAVAIAVSVARAVRLTKAAMAESGADPNRMSGEAAERLVERIRNLQVPCPICGGESFALLGTGNRHKCESCDHEFTGPAHVPRQA